MLGKRDVTPMPIIKVPRYTFSPYNAQATLHFPIGFWALYLPVTVHGRVSDIWRSYFSQALFPRVQASVGFLPRPIVVQDRNLHSYEADFNAEIPLYTRSARLVSYLVSTYVKSQTFMSPSLIETIEALYIDMYERGYVEEDDVFNIQEWISTLIKIGYKFPSIKSELAFNNTIRKEYKILRRSGKSIFNARTNISRLGRKINVAKTDESDINSRNSSFKLTFGNGDVHDGPRIDISSTLLKLDQNFVQLGPELWRSNPAVWSKRGRNLKNNHPVVANMSGMTFYQEHVSSPLEKYIDHFTPMHPSWPKLNAEFYQNDSTVMNIDAFICTFPASMCQLWMPFNKSIIFLPAHR